MMKELKEILQTILKEKKDISPFLPVPEFLRKADCRLIGLLMASGSKEPNTTVRRNSERTDILVRIRKKSGNTTCSGKR